MARSNYAYSGGGSVGMSKEELQEAVATGVAMALMNNAGNLRSEPRYIQANIAIDRDTVFRAVLEAAEDHDLRMNPTPKFGY